MASPAYLVAYAESHQEDASPFETRLRRDGPGLVSDRPADASSRFPLPRRDLPRLHSQLQDALCAMYPIMTLSTPSFAPHHT